MRVDPRPSFAPDRRSTGLISLALSPDQSFEIDLLPLKRISGSTSKSNLHLVNPDGDTDCDENILISFCSLALDLLLLASSDFSLLSKMRSTCSFSLLASSICLASFLDTVYASYGRFPCGSPSGLSVQMVAGEQHCLSPRSYSLTSLANLDTRDCRSIEMYQ